MIRTFCDKCKKEIHRGVKITAGGFIPNVTITGHYHSHCFDRLGKLKRRSKNMA